MKLTYENAGVSIKKADILTAIIQNEVKSDNIGMFAGLYEHPVLKNHYLVGCTDGVGTKIIPLSEFNMIETAAVDLIAMNLNDMICVGASPMFFLDYFATSNLNVEVASRFIKALKEELAKYNCTLLGGETAELNGLVTNGHFDVGGFAVGIVEKSRLLRKENVQKGDIVIGLASSGGHSNGFTLIRRLYDEKLITKDELLELLKPTNIYVNEILELCEKNKIAVCANITGGGIAGNLERVIPKELCAEINRAAIPQSPVFSKLNDIVGEEEAYKTFNMGVGMCIITRQQNASEVMETCKNFNPFILGAIISGKSQMKVNFR